MTRKPLIAGNWKMNLNHLEAISLVQKLSFALPDKYTESIDVAVIPPFTDIRSVQNVVEGDKLALAYGAQDVSLHEAGAYTGEVAASMLEKLGCSYVVIGHSERREYHQETNADVAAKAKITIAHNMAPIVCVGEALEIREQGTHVDYVTEQTKASLAGLSAEELDKVVIAYEPIWAIGTGKVASSGDAQEVCAAIRDTIAEMAGEELAEDMLILYGGSMNAGNVAELVSENDVDGGLVGGASLQADEFARLCALAARVYA